jgi:CBS domain-containing protein
MSVNDRQETDSSSLAELFHLVRSLVPQGQRVFTASPDLTVAEAIQIMHQHNFSQLPIVAGDTVLGIFSFRSLASGLLKMEGSTDQIGDLPVDEFAEHFRFVQPSDNWESTLEHLNSDDGVLVGRRDRLEAIVTSMDVLTYLHEIASPFVLLAEIELSLRRIIQACVAEEQLQQCVKASLASKYKGEQAPTKLSDMTFNDYVQIIAHGRNWPHFTVAFGKSRGQRSRTAARLREVRVLRNEVFHFREQLDLEKLQTLTAHRDWLQRKAMVFDARRRRKATPDKAPAKAEPPKKRKGKKWDEPSFLQELGEQQGAEQVAAARQILEWSKARGLVLRWGRGKTFGTCNVSLVNERAQSPFGLWSHGNVEVHLGYLERFPPFDSAQKRSEWLERLNAIPGIRVSDTETGKFPNIPLAALTNAVALERFLETVDWVINEIERAAAGPDEPTHDDYLVVLTHIPVPPGQQQLYKALYDAGDDGLTHDQLVETMGRRDRQDLSGVLGALGHRISGVPGYGQTRRPGVKMVIAYEQLPDGQQRVRLVPEMRKALEELNPGWLHQMTP